MAKRKRSSPGNGSASKVRRASEEHYTHCGFLLAVGSPGNLLECSGLVVGTPCCIAPSCVPGEISLVPVSEELDCSPSSTPEPSTPSSGGRVSPASGGRGSQQAPAPTPSILVQLKKVGSKNGFRIEGHVVKVVKGEGDATRLVALFDVFIPSSTFTITSRWKAGPDTAFVFSHLRCDWERRNELLASDSCTINVEEAWNLSVCHVFGCQIHASVPNTSKASRFDLQQIFKSLPAAVGEEDEKLWSMIADDESDESSGFHSLPDGVLTSIFCRLSPNDLRRMSQVCRHAHELARSIMPCMKLRLFPHQDAAVLWMLERETNPKPFRNPLYKALQLEDGLFLYVHCVTGELSLELPCEVDDFRGGFFCDEPGLGKTITALSLILKTQGTFASPPPNVEVSSYGNGGAGYYEVATGASPFKRLAKSKHRFEDTRNHGASGRPSTRRRLTGLTSLSTFWAGSHSENQPGERLGNILYFTSILKDHVSSLLQSDTKKAVSWLADQTPSELEEGISVPENLSEVVTGDNSYETIFRAFGLYSKLDERNVLKWFYQPEAKGFRFDALALKAALQQPLEGVRRLFLSKTTLVVVPANLIEHWRTQIRRHTKEGQLRVHVLNDSKGSLTIQALAWNFDVVITTFSRLSVEWNSREESLLMRIHWFRIILDEGHTLGASLALTNKLQMAINMYASRRWILTGTPTPDTPSNQLGHLQPLLGFLHDELYGSPSNSRLWQSAILRPFEAQQEEGRDRLLEFLNRCMISARKADLKNMPPCVKKVKVLDFTDKHAGSYNELVETVRRNILMADWNDPDHVESLLNPKQWKVRGSTLKNVRLACCVAGQIKVQGVHKDIQETMDILTQEGMPSEDYNGILHTLWSGGKCSRCGEWCRLPLVAPCRHFLCLLCVSLDSERCSLPECGRPYIMQVPKARRENPNPKWPVPQDLIELQPAYIQDEWHPAWQATSSSKVAYLVEQLQLIHQASDTSVTNKVIVFSQFLEHLSVIERQLSNVGIQHVGMYSPMHSASKMKSLRRFAHDKDCFVLLMDGSSALGLDLSFASYVYLMEPIWDRSIEEQVVSRAHRMGAIRPVHVETLAMRGTIEEQMLDFLQRSSSSSRVHHDPAESLYLASLTFVR